ncbi:VanZ family protein [Desulfohalobiaceae bacterium Ax17]|uniref:VanZ family protein n=1 Tax=Desulfovulcanus ferrireducens TaxID=2831190 RepID=UPI00207B9FC2|nr:VanZ family protein [Desulfovulcanus ferrireducens]MBT8762800.1 VanZ family protein [Desulfovulcanus ferrireducens]
MLNSRWHILLWFAYLLWLVCASLTPLDISLDVRHGDKLLHGLAYFFMAMLYPWPLVRHGRVFIFVVLTILGSFIELLQSVLPVNRTGDIKDILANSLGIILGLLVLWIFQTTAYKEKYSNNKIK